MHYTMFIIFLGQCLTHDISTPLQTPGYPGYDNDLDVCWTFEAPVGSTVSDNKI